MSSTLFVRSDSAFRPSFLPSRALLAATAALSLVAIAGRPALAQYDGADIDPLGTPGGPQTEATLVAETKTIRPGLPFTVALHLNLEKGWHVYWRNPGDSGTPTHIKWSLPPGFKAGDIQWPAPQKFASDGMVVYGYENDVWLLTQIIPPTTLIPGKDISLGATADWLICSEQCVPQKKYVALQLGVSKDTPTPDSNYKAQFAAARARLPLLTAQSGFTVRADRPANAKVAKSGLNLRFVPALGTTVTAEQLKGLYFYPADESTLSHPATEKVVSEGSGYRIPLTTSEYADAAPSRLRGVLIAPDGVTTSSKALNRGIWVDVPVTVSPSTPAK